MLQKSPRGAQKFMNKNFKLFQACVTFWLSSVLYKKNPGTINHTFEQIEVLLNNIDHSVDAQNFKYQNM